jgi:uncharacterized repeat protein (TIGR03803 family)
MHSAETTNIGVGPRFGSTKPIAAIIRGAVTLAVLSALLMAARPAQAQTESVLYNFTGTPDGLNPYAGLTMNGGNFFGTTYSGGLFGFGSVYELVPNGSGGWTESVLYSFCPGGGTCVDGQNPTFSSLLFDSKGNIYGTAYAGGATGNGVVFELTLSGTAWTETVLYSFTGQPDGANPSTGLIMDTTGNIYGTTYNGGAGNSGGVFELSPNGSGGFTEQVIYSAPMTFATLIMDGTGNLYGTTSSTVFQLKPNGSGGWTPTPIFTFTSTKSATQGSNPNGSLALDSKGNVYGTTVAGGKNNLGVVYKLTLASGKYTEKLLYSFGANGTAPFSGVVFDTAGNLYGTTKTGGKNGAGIVYKLKANSNGSYTERNLQTFIGENGAVPYAGVVVDSKGYLYGTTFSGGSSGDGVVFEVNPNAAVTTTTCTSSLNPSTLGQAVTFSSSAGAPPDGEIVVFEPVGQAPMTNGVATYTTSALKVGQTKITAVYNGDLNFITSKSVSFEQVVNK